MDGMGGIWVISHRAAQVRDRLLQAQAVVVGRLDAPCGEELRERSQKVRLGAADLLGNVEEGDRVAILNTTLLAATLATAFLTKGKGGPRP